MTNTRKGSSVTGDGAPERARGTEERSLATAPRPSLSPDSVGARATGGGPTGRIVYESLGRSMTLATVGPLFITIHRRDYTAEEVAPLHRCQVAFAREQAAPIALLTILDVTERHIVRFGKEAREATLALAREMAPHVRCSAVVFDRGGFAASAIRSLVTTINFLSRQPFPSQVFGDLDAALPWIESKLEPASRFEASQASVSAWITSVRPNEV